MEHARHRAAKIFHAAICHTLLVLLGTPAAVAGDTLAIHDDRRAFFADAARAHPTPFPPPETAWTDLATHWRHLAAQLEAHPEVEVEHLGRSVEARHLWAFHVPARGEETRSVLVLAGLHPMEWIGTEAAFAFLSARIDDPYEHVAVTVVPLAHPDGRARTEGDVRDGHDTYYRRLNSGLVDLNRDWAVWRRCDDAWRPLLPGLHQSSRAPLSQPETRALDGLMARERFDRAASLHAFGGYVFWPFAGRWTRPPDRRAFRWLGRRLARATRPHPYTPMQLGRWAAFFRAHGAEIDHLYGRYATLAFLIEITRTGFAPFQPRGWTMRRRYNPLDPTPHLARALSALDALATLDLPESHARVTVPGQRVVPDGPTSPTP